jgi:hypothetical protein
MGPVSKDVVEQTKSVHEERGSRPGSRRGPNFLMVEQQRDTHVTLFGQTPPASHGDEKEKFQTQTLWFKILTRPPTLDSPFSWIAAVYECPRGLVRRA